MHKNASAYEQRGITFNKYDQFGRLLLTGTLPNNYGWDSLYADKDYSVNQNLTHFESYIPGATNADTANFVCVNMYDKYLKSGIFAAMPDPFSWSQNDANSSRNLKGKLVLTAFRDKPGQGWSYRIYLYDYLGHVNHIYQKFGSAPWKLIAKGINILNNITTENVYKVEGGSLVYEHATWRNYDKQGRLLELRSDPSGNYNSSRQEATYTYNKADQCSTLTYSPVSGANKATTYTYNTTRGWLNSIVNGSGNFSESLGYYGNGNIQSQTITNSVLGGTQTLTYSYDAMNRLTSVLSGTSTREAFQYDADGNITQRNYLSGGASKALYFAPGNRINSMFTETGTDEYYLSYDNRGNVTSDKFSGISNITYDHRNLPLSMTKSTGTSKYRYDDGGNRIFKDAQGGKEYYFRDDLGHELAIYDVTTDHLKTLNLYGNDLIGRIDRTWESEYDPVWDEWSEYWYDNSYYYVKDHLGSIRQTLNEAGVVMSAMDYYAFGGTMSSYVNGSTIDKYKFTGKERDQETGLDYFGARYYNPLYGRWMSVDPLAEKYPGLSPYNYCLNNPLKLSDPDGNEPIDKSDKPKLSNEQKQKLAKAEAQFTVDLFKSVGKSAGNIFAENVAPSLLTASEFGQGTGLALTGLGALTSELGVGVPMMGLGLEVSTWSSVVHGGTTWLVGEIEGNSSKKYAGGIEVGLAAATGGLSGQIEKMSSLVPVAKQYLQATMDWSGSFLNFGVSTYIGAKDKKKEQQKKVSRRQQEEE